MLGSASSDNAKARPIIKKVPIPASPGKKRRKKQKTSENMGKTRLLFSMVAVLIWPASAFVQTCFWDAGSAVRRLRGGSGGGGPRMSAFPTIDLNDGTKHPMVRERESE
jgi:hypothetical protein